MAGLSQGRSYRRQLFDEIFDFSEDDSLFAEDVEEDESAGDQDMNEGGIRVVANTNAIEEGPLTGMLFPCISTMFNFYKEHARLKGFSVFKRSAVNDCRNFIERKRRLRLGDGDAEAIRKLFVRMQKRSEFFYSFDLDDDSRLSNVLWVHPRSRVLTRNSMMLMRLISHEDVNTFKWLFMTWLEAMEDVHPNSILTDQCESMRKAIREVMPNTRHRFCLWHILCKVPEKFKGVTDYDSACLEFKAVIYDSLTIEMEYWVPIYLNHTFWAGMVSTQRSESMHAYFDGYVNSMSTLKQFVEQYEIAMCDKNEKEFYADFKSKNTVVNCISVFEWEQQFQKAFTNSIFKLVQEEIKRMWYCHVIQPTEEGRREADNEPGIERHKIMEKSIINNWFRREFVYDVEYRENGQYFSCNCKKFESKGILCCHIMRLMSLKDIKFINERYLLRRWRKDVNHVHSKKFFHGGYPHMTEEFEKYREMERLFQEASDLAYDDNKIKFVKQRLAELKDLLSWNDGMIAPTSNAQVTIDTNNVDENEENERVILNPHVTRSRGRPRINRHRSVRDHSTSKFW
ncbi:hypothetical protein GH714_032056 [Hevea brasiliensis]|uniref:Protein FAR1-RELATED SEQUENCE n=1 Tax=Hevea brasiliensis TaxID=3981 RepID=A0A6A6LDH3_HEVBR|nr:hypothetical protein GH714_032056 [Hevea brasiliensis]